MEIRMFMYSSALRGVGGLYLYAARWRGGKGAEACRSEARGSGWEKVELDARCRGKGGVFGITLEGGRSLITVQQCRRVDDYLSGTYEIV